MTIFTRILIGLCLIVIQDSCTSAAGLDLTSRLSNDPLFQQVIVRLNKLEHENKVQQRQIEKLEASNAIQQKTIESLQQNVEELKQEMEQLKTSTTREENNNSGLPADAITERNENIKVQDKAPDASNRIRRQQVGTGNVAFTVILTNRLMNLGLNQNVIFDVIETNIGNAFNPQLGVFVAPLSGTYVFHVTIFAPIDEEVWCKIIVTGSSKGDAYAHGGTNNSDTGSQTIIVHLNQGDNVAIRNGQAAHNVYGNDATWTTTFSGFLLHSDAEKIGSNVVG
ncbi:hypothetical protein ACF0H5_006233 [Mactra antiquata]